MLGIALLSGGLDSGVAAAEFAADPANQLKAALYLDYGHRAAAREFAAAEQLAARLGVPIHRYELPWLGGARAHGRFAVARRHRFAAHGHQRGARR